MEQIKHINPADLIKKAGTASAIAALALATTFLPHQAVAGEPITLTPPKGSVTPNAFGRLDVAFSRHPNDRVDFLINGELHGLVPGVPYNVWVCLDSKFDCGTNANPEIRTDQTGSVIFSGLETYMINNRNGHKIASIQVRQDTSGIVGETPKNACYVGATPCLDVPFHVE